MTANPDKWLNEALVQYLNPVSPVLGDPYEHLSTLRIHHPFEIIGGEDVVPAHEEAVSDVLYFPSASKIGDIALDETCCIVICKFKSPDSKSPASKIALWIDKIEGRSRECAIQAATSGDEVSIEENDIGSTIVQVRADVKIEKDKFTVKKPMVYEKGRASAYKEPALAASGLLRVCLSPNLDPRVFRAKVKTHYDVPIR